MSKKLVALLCLILTLSMPSFAQYRMKLGPAFCSMENETTSEREVMFEGADIATVELINRIVDVAGILSNFEVRSYDIFNAEAIVIDDGGGQKRRFILYNKAFLENVRESGGSDWAVLGIMAHEVAHHLNGHTVEKSRSSRDLELAADYSAGFWLKALGATLEQAKSGFVGFSDIVRSGSTHPRRKDRLAAVEKGWTKADARLGKGSTSNPIPTDPSDAELISGLASILTSSAFPTYSSTGGHVGNVSLNGCSAKWREYNSSTGFLQDVTFPFAAIDLRSTSVDVDNDHPHPFGLFIRFMSESVKIEKPEGSRQSKITFIYFNDKRIADQALRYLTALALKCGGQ